MDLFKDIIGSINFKSGNVFDNAHNPDLEKTYNAFVVNRNFSFRLNAVLAANEMNKNHWLDNKMQYDFMYHILPKGKFTKWQKSEDINSLELVKEYYGYNEVKAREALKVLKPSDLDVIRKRLDKGFTTKTTTK